MSTNLKRFAQLRAYLTMGRCFKLASELGFNLTQRTYNRYLKDPEDFVYSWRGDCRVLYVLDYTHKFRTRKISYMDYIVQTLEGQELQNYLDLYC